MAIRQATNFIVIHCSATPPTMDIGRDEIDEWHRARSWSGIGYHFVVRRNGDIEIARRLNEVGAHAAGFNGASVGVCMVGGTNRDGEPEENFTDQQWSALVNLVVALHLRYPQAEVLGHRDLPNVTKACPSFDAPAWWAEIKEVYLDELLRNAIGE